MSPLTEVRSTLSRSGRNARIARSAKEYIETNFHHPVHLEDLSRHTGVGIRMVQRCFREHFDTTITEFLKAVRLDAAYRELAVKYPGDTNVKQVALNKRVHSSRAILRDLSPALRGTAQRDVGRAAGRLKLLFANNPSTCPAHRSSAPVTRSWRSSETTISVPAEQAQHASAMNRPLWHYSTATFLNRMSRNVSIGPGQHQVSRICRLRVPHLRRPVDPLQ